MGESIGVTDMERAALRFDELPPGMLEQLERQTTAFLIALWKAQGKQKRIVSGSPHPLAHTFDNEGTNKLK